MFVQGERARGQKGKGEDLCARACARVLQLISISGALLVSERLQIATLESFSTQWMEELAHSDLACESCWKDEDVRTRQTPSSETPRATQHRKHRFPPEGVQQTAA